MKLSLSFVALATATMALAAPATDMSLEISNATLIRRTGVDWIDNADSYSWYDNLVSKWNSVSRNQWPKAASKSGRVGKPNCQHPSNHCLYLKKGAYTTLLDHPSWWTYIKGQARITCERFDSVGRGRGKCSVPNNQLVTIQCDGENQEVAFVKLTDNSEFKRFSSKGTQRKLGLIWSSQKRTGGHAEYKTSQKGDDLYAECKKIQNGWDWKNDASGYQFVENK